MDRDDTFLRRFHSVTMESTSVWDAQSTKINEQRPFDDVSSRRYYVNMLQLGTSVTVCLSWSACAGSPDKVHLVDLIVASGLQLSENWILSEKLFPQSAAIWQRLPIGNLTGYSIGIRVRPFTCPWWPSCALSG